jgi:hypothetical protein
MDDMSEEKYYTIGNADWPTAHPLVQIVKDFEEALKKIEKFGHSHGHGHGYTCANIAQEALSSSNQYSKNYRKE